MPPYRNHEQELQQELERDFGKLTSQQLWTLTKLAKRVRLRARSNAAYNNMMSRLFPYAKFTTVTKERGDGTSYPGLRIAVIHDAADPLADFTEGDERDGTEA